MGNAALVPASPSRFPSWQPMRSIAPSAILSWICSDQHLNSSSPFSNTPMALQITPEELKSVTFPVVHLNGSGQANLEEQYTKAYLALKEAAELIRKTEFNMRDFYILDEGTEKFYASLKVRNKLRAMLEVMVEYFRAHKYAVKNEKESAELLIYEAARILEQYDIKI
jgi:hypothetical protein